MRSCPRVYGTTQNEQNSLQPSMIVTYALTGSWRRATPSGNDTSSYALTSMSGADCSSPSAAIACPTSAGNCFRL